MKGAPNTRYERILVRIKSLRTNEQTQAIKMLEWMACGFRTLKVRELEDALAINHDDRTIHGDRRLLKARLKDLCGPMVEVTDQETVIFVHFSAKESVKFHGQF